MPTCDDVWIAIPTVCRPSLGDWVAAWRGLGFRVALYLDAGVTLPAVVTAAVMTGKYPGYARAVNTLADRVFFVHGGALMATGGDDVWPDPEWPAYRLRERFFSAFPDGNGIAQPAGGNMHDVETCCIAPLIGRGWWEKHYAGRGPYWPEYWHFWTDAELHDVAWRENHLQLWRDVNWQHDHWFLKGVPPPDHIAKARALNESDHQLYLARKAAGFPGA